MPAKTTTKKAAAPRRPAAKTRHLERHVYGPFELDVAADLARADLEVYRINHFRPSFTVWLFLNDEAVTVDNASTDRPSFAGSFSIFGHQRCSGDVGHCDVPMESRRFDDRPSHPLTKAFKRVVVTDALKRVAGEGGPVRVMVTAIAAADPAEDMGFDGDLLDVGGLQLATFV
jgi:hypothetical protein